MHVRGIGALALREATRLLFFLMSAKTGPSKLATKKEAVYTSMRLSVPNPGSSLGVHQRSLWVSMVNPRMDEEHQEGRDTTIERDVSPQIDMTPCDKENKKA